jgi:hypothetical protein
MAFSPIWRIGCKSTGARELQMKNTKAQSLRYQVEKWFAPSTPVHVTAFGHTCLGRGRYVCVETRRSTGFHALFFFQHEDGYWNVFPPTADTAQWRGRTGTHGG